MRLPHSAPGAAGQPHLCQRMGPTPARLLAAGEILEDPGEVTNAHGWRDVKEGDLWRQMDGVMSNRETWLWRQFIGAVMPADQLTESW